MAEKKSGMTVQEAGRLGGEKGGKIVRERYGHEFYEEIGKKGGHIGGEKVARERGHEFYEEIGHKGGQRVRELIEEGKKHGK